MSDNAKTEIDSIKKRLDAIENIIWPGGNPPSGPTIFGMILDRLDAIEETLKGAPDLQELVTKEEFDEFRRIVAYRPDDQDQEEPGAAEY